MIIALYFTCGVVWCLYYKLRIGPAGGLLAYAVLFLAWPFWAALYLLFFGIALVFRP